MSETVSIPFDPSLFDYVLNAYSLEAKLLSQAAGSEYFRTTLSELEDYPRMMQHAPGRFAGMLECCRDVSGVLDVGRHRDELEELHVCMNLAAACAVFGGWRLRLDQINEIALDAMVNESIPAFHQQEHAKVYQLCDKLNGGDTIRIFTLLRLLGLLPDDLSNRCQLSLGAARGVRDIHSMHLYPEVHYQRSPAIVKEPVPETVAFNTHLRPPQDAILVDNHPVYRAYYDSLAEKHEARVIGVPRDSYEAMEMFHSDPATAGRQPRDLVVAFRIDHRGIPDPVRFLKLIGSVIADKAGLVITMGSGHSLEEFMGRVATMKALREALDKAGMDPTHIVWHRGKSMQERFQTPLFGDPGCASYEILYSELDKQALERL